MGQGLDVLQPAKASDPALLERMQDLAPDVATVVAYGKILPAQLLAVPRLGFVNVHFSILPEYRGAAPVQRAVMDGRNETGVSMMVLTEGMDEGPVLGVKKTVIAGDDTAGTVGDRLAELGASLLVETLHGYAAGELTPREQDHARATYAPKITNEETRIDWARPAEEIDAFVRGLHPVPGAWALLKDKRLKVHRVQDAQMSLGPGEMAEGRALIVGTGTHAVALTDVQLEGKKRMSGEELRRGLRTEPGDRLQ